MAKRIEWQAQAEPDHDSDFDVHVCVLEDGSLHIDAGGEVFRIDAIKANKAARRLLDLTEDG